MQKHHADTEQMYGGEAKPDDSKTATQLIKAGLEKEESSCVVSDV